MVFTDEERKLRKRASNKRYEEKHKDLIRDRRKLKAQEASKRSRAWYAVNKEYASERQKIYNRQNRDSKRKTDYIGKLKREFGISIEEYNLILERQNFSCAICFTSTPGKRNWQLDHDHRNGNIRGVLCHSCNVALGLFKDDPQVLLSATKYLGR